MEITHNTNKVMIKYLFLLLTPLQFSIGGLSAQNANTLLGDDSDKMWYFYGYDQDYNELFTESYQFGETYEKNGKIYTKLMFNRGFLDSGSIGEASSEGIPPFNPPYIPTGIIGVRESEGRIFVDRTEYMDLLVASSYWSWEGNADYLPYEMTEKEIILYDFTKNQGDKFIHIDGHEDIIVENVETIVTRDGKRRRMQTLSNGLIVIEGIGCVNSPGMWLFYMNPSISQCKAGVMERMYNAVDMQNVIFSWEDMENYTVRIVSIANPSDHFDCYDLQGRRITAEPQRGLYIRDGKKYVVKE